VSGSAKSCRSISIFADCGQPRSAWAIHRVIRVLGCRARCDGATSSVFIRAGSDLGGNEPSDYHDLGDRTGRAYFSDSSGDATQLNFLYAIMSKRSGFRPKSSDYTSDML
jgi:hypothetical protein